MAVGFVAVGHRKPSEMSPDRQPVTAANPGLRPSRRVAGRAKRFGREGCQKAIRAEELQPRGAKRILGFPSRFSKACS